MFFVLIALLILNSKNVTTLHDIKAYGRDHALTAFAIRRQENKYSLSLLLIVTGLMIDGHANELCWNTEYTI